MTFVCDQGYELEPLAEIEGAIQCGRTVAGSTAGARSVHGEAAGEHLYHFSIPATSYTIAFDACASNFAAVLRINTLDLTHEFYVGYFFWYNRPADDTTRSYEGLWALVHDWVRRKKDTKNRKRR